MTYCKKSWYGSTETAGWYDSAYLSPDTTLEASDIPLGDFPNISYLNPGEGYVQTHEFKLPIDLRGSYYALVKADSRSQVNEGINENNNTGFNATPMQVNLSPPPDIQVASIISPPTGWSGQPVAVNWTVANKGSGPTVSSTWYDTIYLSKEKTLNTTTDYHFGPYYHTGILSSGESYIQSQTFNLPVGVSGTYYIFVATDVNNNVYEHVWEDNNVMLSSTPLEITLSPPPDLEVTQITAPAEGLAGKTISISWAVANNGAGPTDTVSWMDTVYLSADQTLETGTDTFLGSFRHYGILDTGQSYIQSQGITLPKGISGSYYLIVNTDAGKEVFEHTWEDNNIGHSPGVVDITLQPPPPPDPGIPPSDLVVTSLAVPSSAKAEEQVEVTWIVSNAGQNDTAAAQWNDKVYLSADNQLNTRADVLLGTFPHSGVIVPAGSYTQRQTVTLPYWASGTNYLFVLTDADNSVYEHLSENNNSAFNPIEIEPLPLPDLEMTLVDAPESGSSGQVITVSWIVTNLGQVKTRTSSWNDAVYLSSDGALDTNIDIQLGSYSHTTALNSGASYDVSKDFVLPDGIYGPYYIFVVTDINNSVQEAIESNNTGYDAVPVTIGLTPWSDLRVTSVVAPQSGWSGQPITLKWTVSNSGDGATNKSGWFDAVYLSRNYIFSTSSAYKVGYLQHEGVLPPGGSYSASLNASVPSGLAGPYYVFIYTDSQNSVFEHTDENNNVLRAQTVINVTQPPPADLTVSQIVVPASAYPGGQVSISWSVTNQGDFDAIGQWSDAIYLSSDTAWDINDTMIGSVLHSGTVSPAGSYTSGITADLPGVKPGNYYIIVRTDIKNNVREDTGENNNMGVSTGVIAIDVIYLTLGVPHASQLATGTMHYYKVNVPAGEDLLITLDSESINGSNELFVRYGDIPDRINFDYLYDAPFRPDQEISASDTREGAYYILVHSEAAPEGTSNYTITARVLNFSIRKLTPDKGGNVGDITIEVNGARFKSGIHAELIDANGQIIPAKDINFIDGVTIYTTFNLMGLTPGLYDLRLTNPDGLYAESQHAFDVVPGQGPKLLVRLITPSSVRPDRDFTVWVEYANAGDTDMIPPLLVVSSSNGARMSLNPDDTPMNRPAQILGVSFTGLPGVLRPGTEQSIPVYSHSPAAGGQMKFSLNSWLAGDRPVSDWNATEARIKPADMDPASWDIIWSSFRVRMGDSWRNYLSVLAEDSNFLYKNFGDVIYSVDDLFQFELNMAIGE